MLEMLLPGMCVDYHQGHQGSLFSNVRVATLFADPEEAYAVGERKGYTHLLGASKKNSSLLSKLQMRVSSDYPQEYRLCEEYCRQESHHMEIL